MTSNPRPAFRWRAFVSVALFLSALSLPISAMLLEGPPSPAKAVGKAMHSSGAALFVVFALAHLVLNGRTMLAHLRSSRRALIGKEALIATVLVVGLMLLAVLTHGGEHHGPPNH